MATTKKSRQRANAPASAAPDKMIDMLHQIWLAGLGAVSKAKHGAPQVLEDLIAEGARVHSQARGAAENAIRSALGDAQSVINTRLSQVKSQATDSLENLEKIFQTRVHRVLTQLGAPSAEDVEALGKRVDALNTNVEKLARARGKSSSRQRASTTSRSSPRANA